MVTRIGHLMKKEKKELVDMILDLENKYLKFREDMRVIDSITNKYARLRNGKK